MNHCGAFDPAIGTVRWSETAEDWAPGTPDLERTTRGSGRITGFAECREALRLCI